MDNDLGKSIKKLKRFDRSTYKEFPGLYKQEDPLQRHTNPMLHGTDIEYKIRGIFHVSTEMCLNVHNIRTLKFPVEPEINFFNQLQDNRLYCIYLAELWKDVSTSARLTRVKLLRINS